MALSSHTADEKRFPFPVHFLFSTHSALRHPRVLLFLPSKQQGKKKSFNSSRWRKVFFHVAKRPMSSLSLSLSLSLSSTSIYISRYNHHPEIQVMDTISYGTSLYNRYLDSGSYKIPFLLWCILILATSRWEIYDGRDVTTAPPVRGQSVRDRLPCPVTNKDVEEVTLKEI